MKNMNRHNIIKIAAVVTLVVFTMNTVVQDYALALQPELRLKREDFKSAFEIKYAVEQARSIIELVEERGARKPNTIDDIKRWIRSSEPEFEGAVIDVQEGQVLIKMPQNDVIIRYYNPEVSSNIPKGTISASYWQLDERLNRRLARQLLYTGRLQDALAAAGPSLVPAEYDYEKANISSFGRAKLGRETQDRYIDTTVVTARFTGRLMAIFDGHFDGIIAERLHQEFTGVFKNMLEKNDGNVQAALKNTIEYLGEKNKSEISGSTLSAVYMPKGQSMAYGAVVGDSPIMWSTSDGEYWYGPRHNMDNEKEKNRVEDLLSDPNARQL